MNHPEKATASMHNQLNVITSAENANVAGKGDAAVQVSGLTHRFGKLVALREVSFKVPQGGIYGLLGPNGSGKSTLFRILSTYLLPSAGKVLVGGFDICRDPDAVRSRIAVVFQEPSVDEKLTVVENLRHHGYCYGLSGGNLQLAIHDMINRFSLEDRGNDRVEILSGGMRRKVEIAKGLLSEPEIVLMDEPTTGLDPRARRDFWDLIEEITQQQDITFITTTHLMDEADRCDRVAILDAGGIVAEDSPAALRNRIGREVVEIQSEKAALLAEGLEDIFDITVTVFNHTVRFDSEEGHHLVPKIVDRFREHIQEITVRKPTLEDVFIHLTGHRMEDA